MKSNAIVLASRIESRILMLHGQKVLLDADLAALYGVETKMLVRAVKRNFDRFPEDFMFQLTRSEFSNLRCQFGTSSRWGGRRFPPYAFSEQGVAMLSSVLNSPRAIRVNIEIMRAFVRLRRVLASHADLERKLQELERRSEARFEAVFKVLKDLMIPPRKRRRKIGFRISRTN